MHTRLLVVLLSVIAIVLGACGIPLDDEPQIIASDELPTGLQPTTTTTTTIPIQQRDNVTIYLVDPAEGDIRLVPVSRQVPESETNTPERLLQASLEQLLLGPTSEEQLEGDLTTFVVAAGDEPIEVLEVQRPSANLVAVVLSEPPAIEGNERRTSFAQLVFTLTEFSEIDLVRFLVRTEDGVDEFITVATDTEEGDVNSPVGRGDYSSVNIGASPV